MNLSFPPLSLALADLPVEAAAGDLFRAQVVFAREAGFRAVHLNAAAPGMRARELARSERRDIASLLRRNEVVISGADLWIPPEHYVDAARVDRAVEAVLAAIELVADLDRLLGGSEGRVICISLPGGVDEAVISAIAGKAVACGARVADFGGGIKDSGDPPGVMGPGFDPAAYLLANPGATLGNDGAVKLSSGLIGARLTDAGTLGRVAPGSGGGRLDLLAYGVALVTSGYRGHVIVDVRGLPEPLENATRALAAWGGIGQPA